MVSIARFDLNGLVPLVLSFVRPTTFSGQFMQNDRKPLTKNLTQAFNPAVSYYTDTSIKELEICPKPDRP